MVAGAPAVEGNAGEVLATVGACIDLAGAAAGFVLDAVAVDAAEVARFLGVGVEGAAVEAGSGVAAGLAVGFGAGNSAETGSGRS